MGSPALPQDYRMPGRDGAGFGLGAEHPGKWDSHDSPPIPSAVFFIWLEGQHFGPRCSSPNSVEERRKRPLGAVESRGRQAKMSVQPRSGRPARPGSRTRSRGAAGASPRTGRLRTGEASLSAPTARCPADRRAGCGRERGRGSAKNSPRLIKRWGPVPAPYKYARCVAGGLWPARLGSAGGAVQSAQQGRHCRRLRC
ncbi:unnamed protein product [Coccothraustes coccothraustes]